MSSSRRSPEPLLTLTSCLLAAPLLLSACGNKKKQALDDERNAPPPSTAAYVAPLSEDDLRAVCAGKGEARAKAYSKNDPAAHSILVFTKIGADADFARKRLTAFDRFRPEKPELTELVACVARTAEKKVSTCDFDATPPTHYLDMHEATYEISIREAKTASVVSTKTVSLPAGGCPTLHMFSAEREPDYPSADFVLIEMAGATLLPPAPGADLKYPNPDAVNDKLFDDQLDSVCYGIPEPRAAAYQKTPGSLSPTLLLVRTSDNDQYSKVYISEMEPWKSEDAARYQLVICSTEKSRAKKKECKFDEKQPVHILDLYSATYDVTLREARTAKILATKTVTQASDNICPTMWFFHSTHDADVPRAEKPILALVKPFAQP